MSRRFGATYHQVHRADLHVTLAEAILRNDPDCVFLDHCFKALTQDFDHVAATFTNGKTYTSDVLIGCDGGASKVRSCVFGDEVVNYTGQVAFPFLRERCSNGVFGTASHSSNTLKGALPCSVMPRIR